MQASQPSPLARDDTLLGICHALGEDIGFNPVYLRVTLAVMLLWNPTIVVGAYAGLGILVLLTRWIAPNPRFIPASEPRAEAVQPRNRDAGEPEPLQIAA
jgi:phage shock protein C